MTIDQALDTCDRCEDAHAVTLLHSTKERLCFGCMMKAGTARAKAMNGNRVASDKRYEVVLNATI